MREIIIFDFGRRNGKSKALKEMLKNKKTIVVKVEDETYEREKKSFSELEKKTICFNEWQKINSKKLKTLLDKNVNFNLEQTQKIYKSWFMGINEENKNNNRSDEVMDKIESAFKKLRKQDRKNEKKMQKETLYIDYFGEILPLHEALDRFYKHGVPKTK